MARETISVIKSGFYLGGDSLADLSLAGMIQAEGCDVQLIAGFFDVHAEERARSLNLPFVVEPALDRKQQTYDSDTRSRILTTVAASAGALISQPFMGQKAAFEEYALDIAAEVPATFRIHDDVWPQHTESLLQVNDRPGSQVCGTTQAVIDHASGLGLEAEGFVIPPLIDEARFDFSPSQQRNARLSIRTALGIAEDDILLLQATRVEERKGIDYSLRLAHAMQALLKDRNVFLVVTGGDEPILRAKQNKQSLLALADELSFRRLVFLNGLHEKPGLTIPHIMHASDLVCCPSRVEGFSLTPAEAFLCKKPVVARDFRSLTGKPIYDQVYGDFWTFLDSVDNPYPDPAFVHTIYEALINPEVHKDRALHNQLLARQRFTQHIFKSQPDLLHRLIARVSVS